MVKMVDFIKRLLPADLSAQVDAIRAHTVGERLEDFGTLEDRKDLSGCRMETSCFSSRRDDGVYLYLNVTERTTGKTSTQGYPISPGGIEQLRAILEQPPEALFPPIDPATAPTTRFGRFKKWLGEGLEGEILRDCGCIDEVLMRGPASASGYYWSQELRVLTTRKGGEDLLVLRIKYRAPGLSGDIFVPFGEDGRAGLGKVLGRI